ASRYAAGKSRPPACKPALRRSVSFAFSAGVARRYAERGWDAPAAMVRAMVCTFVETQCIASLRQRQHGCLFCRQNPAWTFAHSPNMRQFERRSPHRR
ncbi:MAG: hypothetical protein LBR08_04310, partial [Bacteroidales bacterium]|nr:hypothetical protein [Bacteroidales bacterium]